MGGGLTSPRRPANDAAEVDPLVLRVFLCEYIGFDIAEGSLWFMFYAVIEGLDDVFLEMFRSRKPRQNLHSLRFIEIR